eukprot:896743-Pleurochrysis_carterae.AAC.4
MSKEGLTTNLNWRLQFQENRLAHEDLPGTRAKPADLRLCKIDLLAWPAATHLQQLSDELIHIKRGRGGSRHHVGLVNSLVCAGLALVCASRQLATIARMRG